MAIGGKVRRKRRQGQAEVGAIASRTIAGYPSPGSCSDWPVPATFFRTGHHPPQGKQRKNGPRAEWKALAIRIRELQREGLSVSAAGSRIGVDGDRAREILAEWPAAACAS